MRNSNDATLVRATTGLIVLLVLAIPFGSSQADPPDTSQTSIRLEDGTSHWRKNLFKRVVSDQKYLIRSWAPSEVRRPAMYLPLLASTAAALDSDPEHPGFDVHLSRSIARLGDSGARPTARALTKLGDGPTGLVLVGGTWLISRFSGNTRMARASSLSAEAMLDSALWSGTLKRLARRGRPNSETQGGVFLVSDPATEATSFPSGHAMGAFAVATVFAGEYRDRRWVPWLAYGTAGLVGASRVALGRHFVSDVVAGGLLGSSLGRMVLARERGVERGGGTLERFEPILEPSRQTYGLAYHHSW